MPQTMATSAFCAVARIALPRRWIFRKIKTLMEMKAAITKLMILLLLTAIVSVSWNASGA